jgi:hypothetical protein
MFTTVLTRVIVFCAWSAPVAALATMTQHNRKLFPVRSIPSSYKQNNSGLLRVEAGKNTSTAISASRKRRRKGNPVVSDETVMYGYESSETLITDRLHYKLQTRPVIREGAPRRRAKQFSGKRKGKKSGHRPQRGARHQGILTDWPSVVK